MKIKTNTVDSFLSNPNRTTYSVVTGRTFRKGPIVRGVGALAFGLLLLYGFIKLMIDSPNPFNLIVLLFALIFILGGCLILFAKEGVEIDANRKQVKEFMLFIVKFGSWQSIEKYPQITVIKENKTVFYGSYVGTITYDTWRYSRAKENEEFEVCLLNKTHYKRIGLYFTKEYADAKQKCDELAKILEVEITEFEPVRISERKNRRK